MDPTDFQWKCQPEAEKLVEELLLQALERQTDLQELSQQLETKTSTRLFDWLDYIQVAQTDELLHTLEQAGFVVDQAMPRYRVFSHPGAQMPRLILCEEGEGVTAIGLAVERIEDFLLCRGGGGCEIEGTPYSGFRRCCISMDQHIGLWIVERRGSSTMEPTYEESDYIVRYLEAETLWAQRCRDLDDEEEAMRLALHTAEEMIYLVGRDAASWIVMDVERRYWQSRNLAGQIQKNRQDRLGFGWANHDHHTFRSSRRHFSKLVRLCEMLGFRCRERFYAGLEAGWGAQVMENRTSRLVLFLDVDLSPEEISLDFAHQKLPERDQLGTIGLWCALHGDSILKAGMHHLEAQFVFDLLREDLKRQGIGMMEPFSNFPYLKQAFTQGEIWPVTPERLKKLLQAKLITEEQSQKFAKEGAVGSHMENLQRREGFKGFNQKNVSLIIKKTDPRTVELSK